MSTAERLEELRDLPRVSAEDRRRYGNMQSAAEIQLELYEPLHSRRERRLALRHGRSVVWLEPHNPESLHMHPLLWRKHWRSLPDYDGPPMRAPSGFVVRFPAVEAADPSGSVIERDELHRRLRSLGAQKKRARRVDAADAVLAFGMAGALCFDAPPRGRGWCPKLAGVAT